MLSFKKGIISIVLLFLFCFSLLNAANAKVCKEELCDIGMKETVKFLASEELEGRGFGSKGLNKAADFIAQRFHAMGLKPGGDKNRGYFQEFEYIGGDPKFPANVKNVIGIVRGHGRESIVIGAHYDHLGRGWPDLKEEKYRGNIHAGANDNASGVAILLELAEYFSSQRFRLNRNIVFVAFTCEEAGRIGSKYFLYHTRVYGKCIGMINLDTVGRLDGKNPLVLGAKSAEEWESILQEVSSRMKIDIDLVPIDLDSSDQTSFHEAGIPAIQIFSGMDVNYHKPTDTVEKIDFRGMEKIALFTKDLALKLANHGTKLTSRAVSVKKMARNNKKRISLGTIPDVTYGGIGYRLAGVRPNTPAAKAGLQKGDIIIKINSTEINGMAGLAKILYELKNGDVIVIEYLRDKGKFTTKTKL